jgi:hypothetical protein
MIKNMKFLTLLFIVIIFLIINEIIVLSQANAFDLFTVSDLENIFEDGYNCPPPERTIDVFGIGDEYISAQCVIKAKEELQNVTVSVSPLINDNFDISLPSNSVSWNYIGSIPIKENTPTRKASNLIRIAPALFPDYLSEERDISLKKDKYQAVWLTIKVPRDAQAGNYSGMVTVKTDKGNASLPLHLTIYPLTLPHERHLNVTMWYTTIVFDKFHHTGEMYSEKFFDMLKVYADNMANHRQNVFSVDINSIIIKQDAKVKLKFDFSLFDRWAQIFWDTRCMDLLETGFLARFGEGGWSSKDIFLKDFKILNESANEFITIPGEECIPQFLPVFENHLREKGWLDKTVFHIQDEPSVHNVLRWREISEYIHKYTPLLKRIDAIEITNAFDRLEIWVPKINNLDAWFDLYKQAQHDGYELWFYTVGIYQAGVYPNRIVDGPLIESRILHWVNYRFGITGYLHWGFNQWTEDPFSNPGMHRGDGWQVYPKKDGLINSIRWEQMRNGIQDYEYFWLLEDKIKSIISKAGKSSEMFDPSRRGQEIAANVVKTMRNYSRSPYVLYSAKKQIIDEIFDLDSSPLLIVQTNPPEFSNLVDRTAVELIGMTDPGTKIIVNDRELPVSSDGLFMEVIYVYLKSNTIVVTAKNEKGTKTAVRYFDVVY